MENMNNTTEEVTATSPLHRLAELMGVGVRYVGSDNKEHEIQDNVLVSVLGALGVDASSEDAIEKSTQDILAYRHGRIIAPTVLHTVGQCDEVTVNTGILEYPVATLTLENGEKYNGDLVIVPNEHDVAYPVNGKFVATSLVKIPADVPMGYHTLRVTVGERSEEATLISAPESIDTLNSLEANGEQLWGWMAQLYSIRSSKSWGVGDFADLATLLTEAKQKTGADFVLINPMHAGEPVAPLTPTPFVPLSRGELAILPIWLRFLLKLSRRLALILFLLIQCTLASR